MRIIIVNKFYYPRGGDCVCAMNLEQLLREKGHDVAVFAMQYPENVKTDFDAYFPAEVSFGGGIGGKLKAASRLFAPSDVAGRFAKLLDDFRPDVVHLHNIHSYISPVVGQIAHERGIRVVWTMHDYKLVCPSYACLSGGKPCTECFADKNAILRKRCMKGSAVASLLAWLEARYWTKAKLQRLTDTFICPSRFMSERLAEAGFDKNKLTVLNNFVDISAFDKTRPTRADYYCYVGRLSEEKGVRTLLAAASQLPYELRVLGGGPLAEELRAKYASCPNIKFLGHQSAEGVRANLADARFSVMPSVCFENNPLGVIESLCMGTPVLGARIGGIPELIEQGNGLTFESGNRAELIRRIEEMMNQSFDYDAIQKSAQKRLGKDDFYKKLSSLYE
jgi:glycosyltransferase involved in cell wall biosynthesis